MFGTIDAQRQVEVGPVAEAVIGRVIIDARPALALPICVAAQRDLPIVRHRPAMLNTEIGGPVRRVGQFVAAQIGPDAGTAVNLRLVEWIILRAAELRVRYLRGLEYVYQIGRASGGERGGQ